MNKYNYEEYQKYTNFYKYTTKKDTLTIAETLTEVFNLLHEFLLPYDEYTEFTQYNNRLYRITLYTSYKILVYDLNISTSGVINFFSMHSELKDFYKEIKLTYQTKLSLISFMLSILKKDIFI